MPNQLRHLPQFMHEGLRENGFKDGNNWSAWEIIDAWLTWEGIIGYTDLIMTAVTAAKQEAKK